MTTYLVTAHSESGDDYTFGVYNDKPTEEHLLAIAVSECDQEIFDGECYLHFNVEEIAADIKQLPEPYTKGDISFI